MWLSITQQLNGALQDTFSINSLIFKVDYFNLEHLKIYILNLSMLKVKALIKITSDDIDLIISILLICKCFDF